ncbi:MAG: hypothetical protein ACTS6J_16975 [Burkholderiales bacterium]
MALERIQDLPAAALPLSGPELVELEQGGVSKQCTVQDIVDSAAPYAGAAGQIAITGLVIGIDPAYVGQASITTLGAIATGVWNATEIAANKGGTGQTAYAVGDLLYASGVAALSKLAAGANGHILTLAAGVPSWAAAPAGFANPMTTTGDMIYSNPGSTAVRLAAGTNGHLLTLVAGLPAWAAAPAAAWGSLTGSLSAQTDLQAALDAKAPLLVLQNSQSAAYTLVAADSGKQIYHPIADTAARIWTIPANSSVPFPIGTVVTFINDNAAGAITIAITTDTLRLAGSGATGSRTLAANGIATAVKITATSWQINGTNLT